MKTEQNKNLSKIALFLLVLVVCTATYAQAKPVEIHHSQQISSSQAPSQVYYNNNLRSGEWEEDGGPGGSGIDNNNPVVVPVGEGTAILAISLLGYTLLRFRKVRQ